MRTRRLKALVAATLAIALLAGCSKGTTNENKGSNQVTGLSTDATKIAQERGLSPADVAAALKTYVPSGKRDEAVMFSSGGHSGQVIAIGVPSMRILKIIPVFTPESWTGYGYNDETRALLKEGMVAGKEITWGDTHHPNISETNAEYDGQFLFINDKVHGRVGVVDLRDWETKQIVKNPLMIGDHGGAFVTPNTEYVIETSQYATPWPGTQADIREYKEKYRGAITFWKFDRSKGRIDKSQSFAIELPPYWQDLCDAGKGPSDGLIFCNSINTEMATGKIEGWTGAHTTDTVSFTPVEGDGQWLLGLTPELTYLVSRQSGKVWQWNRQEATVIAAAGGLVLIELHNSDPGTRFVVADADMKPISLFTAAKGPEHARLNARFAPDGRKLVVVGHDRSILLVDVASGKAEVLGKAIAQREGYHSSSSLRLSPDGAEIQVVVQLYPRGGAEWKPEYYTEIQRFSWVGTETAPRLTVPSSSAYLSPNGKLVAYETPFQGKVPTVVIADAATGEEGDAQARRQEGRSRRIAGGNGLSGRAACSSCARSRAVGRPRR